MITRVAGLNTDFSIDSNKSIHEQLYTIQRIIPILHRYCLIGISAFVGVGLSFITRPTFVRPLETERGIVLVDTLGVGLNTTKRETCGWQVGVATWKWLFGSLGGNVCKNGMKQSKFTYIETCVGLTGDG